MITSTPRLSHPAFNPIIFKCEKTGDETQETIVITSEIEEINVSTGLIETISQNEEITRDYTDDITFINISPSVKRLFYKGPLQEMTEKIVADKKLFARYSVDSSNYLAINSSLQVKEKQKTSGDVLSYMESFDKYEDYLLDVSILSESGFPSNKGEFEAMSVCRYRVDDNETEALYFDILLGTSRGNLIMTNKGNFIGINGSKFSLKITQKCTPLNPFYLRWINTQGGVDYFMFNTTQETKTSLKSVDTFEPYIITDENYNELPFGKEAEITITAYAEGLTKDKYKSLSMLPMSNYIEWYNEELGEWIYLNCKKSDNTYVSFETMQSIDIEFYLPKINLQF